MKFIQAVAANLPAPDAAGFAERLRALPGVTVSCMLHDAWLIGFGDFTAFTRALFVASPDPYAALAERLGVTRADVKRSFFTALYSVGSSLAHVPEKTLLAGADVVIAYLLGTKEGAE